MHLAKKVNSPTLVWERGYMF